jgi:hypothetical protein
MLRKFTPASSRIHCEFIVGCSTWPKRKEEGGERCLHAHMARYYHRTGTRAMCQKALELACLSLRSRHRAQWRGGTLPLRHIALILIRMAGAGARTRASRATKAAAAELTTTGPITMKSAPESITAELYDQPDQGFFARQRRRCGATRTHRLLLREVTLPAATTRLRAAQEASEVAEDAGK